MTDPDRPPPDDPASDPLAAPLGTLFDALDALLADEAARHARLDELLAREREHPVPAGVLWWCSFVDEERFLGVVVTAAPGAVHAVRRTHELGLNPGGEVAVVPVPARTVPVAYRDRLLDDAACAELNALADPDEEEP